MMDHSRAGLGSGDRILNAVKRNPEGLLLLGAGLALLLRGTSQTRPKFRAFNDDRDDIHRSGRRAAAEGTAETISDVAANVRDVASDVGAKVSETVSGYASSAGEFAEDTRRAVMDKSGQYAQRAQSSIQDVVDRTLEQQPLALALAGFAAGAAVAAAFPASRMERRTLGPSANALSSVAASAQQKLTEAASAAGGEIKRAAEERGLNASGMVEVAEGVAGAVEDSLAGKQDNRGKRSDNGGSSRSDRPAKGKSASEESKTSGKVTAAGTVRE